MVKNGPEVSFYPNKERKSPFYLAADAGDEELVKLMIDTVPLLPYGKSIIHAAIYYLMTITNLPYGKSVVHAAIKGSFTARKIGNFQFQSILIVKTLTSFLLSPSML